MRDLVMIAEHASSVRSLRLSLREAPGFRVVATLDGRSPARAELAKLDPDVVLVGEICQRTNLLARIREARDVTPAARIVVLSSDMDPALLDDAFAAGAHMSIERRLHPKTLATLLREVARGGIQAPSSRPPLADDHPAPATYPELRLVSDQDATARTSA